MVSSMRMRSGFAQRRNGFGTGRGGGRVLEAERMRDPMTGIRARSQRGAGMEPLPTMLRRVSGKNLYEYGTQFRRGLGSAGTYSMMRIRQTPAAITINQNMDLIYVSKFMLVKDERAADGSLPPS